MAVQTNPNEKLAQKSLPGPLRRAIQATFVGGLPDCALVGGTALAGFYACHRESDDMDLFTGNQKSQSIAVAAVKSLTTIGAVFSEELTTPSYYHALVVLDHHRFTVDVVLDTNLHRIGEFVTTSSGITVANLETLLKMKIATLVSRCSAKGFYDLVWLTENYRFPDFIEWLQLGQMIDGGATAEAMLIAIIGADLRESACGFAVKFGISAAEVLKRITEFKVEIESRLVKHLESTPADASIAPLIRRLRKLRSSR